MDKNNKILWQIFIKCVGQIDKYKLHSIPIGSDLIKIILVIAIL